MTRIMACARGRVQGVGYRFFVDDCARETGVTGFVRNMPDGSVVVVAEGSDNALERFLRMIRAAGRGRIRVDSLEVSRGEATGEFSGFQIRT
jgi:acylphosphatase